MGMIFGSHFEKVIIDQNLIQIDHFGDTATVDASSHEITQCQSPILK